MLQLELWSTNKGIKYYTIHVTLCYLLYLGCLSKHVVCGFSSTYVWQVIHDVSAVQYDLSHVQASAARADECWQLCFRTLSRAVYDAKVFTRSMNALRRFSLHVYEALASTDAYIWTIYWLVWAPSNLHLSGFTCWLAAIIATIIAPYCITPTHAFGRFRWCEKLKWVDAWWMSLTNSFADNVPICSLHCRTQDELKSARSLFRACWQSSGFERSSAHLVPEFCSQSCLLTWLRRGQGPEQRSQEERSCWP